MRKDLFLSLAFSLTQTLKLNKNTDIYGPEIYLKHTKRSNQTNKKKKKNTYYAIKCAQCSSLQTQ